MDLIAISYKNIGPFKDKLISIFFDNGKYLVKAPIGSGKSFLFFDGPMYGLYKYSSRNMLNILSKEGFIKLLRDFEGEKFLLVRKLIKGKAKDSCQSTLFKIDGLGNLERTKNELLIENIDIQEILQDDKTINIEEIKFKNETDLQSHLNSFLQPREVFLSTVFLMQDNDNIFEMLPAERLNVLKNVFGLLGIDEAKEKIMEKRREIIAQIKANEDSSKYDLKLRKLIQEYLEAFKSLEEFKEGLIDFEDYKEFLDDMEMIKDKVNINEFEINNFPVKINKLLDEKIEIAKNEYNKILNQKENLIKNKEEIEKNEKTLNDEKIQIEREKQKVETKINMIDENKLNELKKRKGELKKDIEDIDDKYTKINIEDLRLRLQNLAPEQQIENLNNIFDYYNLVQELVAKGSLYKAQKDGLESEIKNAELLKEKEIERLNSEIKNLEEKKVMRDDEMRKINERIKDFQKNVDEQEKFECEKIGTNCPFIKVINKKTFENLEEQKKKLYEEKEFLEKKIKDEDILTKLKAENDKLKAENEKPKIESKKSKEMKEIQDKIDGIKEFLNKIDYKKIGEIYKEYQNLDKSLKNIDKEISVLEVEFTKLQEYKLDLEKIKIRIENIDTKIIDIRGKILDTIGKIQDLEKEIAEGNFEEIIKIEKINIGIKENIRDISSLVEDFKKSKVQIKKLQEDEKILNNLYQIFSKELLLIVLQDSLPILNDIINSFLSQVVDYQISFDLNKSDSEKLELDIKIFDDKGSRDVKSLSGGQRIILKLVRMLAISSYIRSPILFLDETINNLDTDTVGKVADMLEDFVKSRNMKFYVVTHSQQIQDMDIRDKTIEII